MKNLLALAFACLCLSTVARADEADGTATVTRADAYGSYLPPKYRLMINNLLVLRYNPLGFEDQIRAGMQMRMYVKSAPILRDNFIFFGMAPKINPAFVKFGPSLEVQPLAILNLRLGFEVMSFFSSFGYLQSFSSPRDDYSDSTLEKGKNAGANYSSTGFHVLVEPTLMVPLVRRPQFTIALRNKFAFEYWRMNVHAGDTTFYEATLDTLVPANGYVIANDLDLLYIRRVGKRLASLSVGARYSAVHPFYKASDYAGLPPSANSTFQNSHQRLGVLLAYTFFDKGYTRFNKPTLLLIASWYVDHRFRTGADVSQGVPYLVLGFAFQSDFLKPER